MGLRARRIAWTLLALLAALAAFDLWQAARIRQLNLQIDAGGSDEPGAPAELRFAKAVAQAASGAAGAGDAALNAYSALHDDPRLGRAARYNGANLLLRQAIELRAHDQPGQALALIELGKEGYRELLRQDPGDWPARYNLERAQRLVPEIEPGEEEQPDDRKNAERAATTMRGYSPGLP
jgi:mxaK protein